jgi:hypothetical protein
VQNDEYRTTYEFDERMNQREFTLDQVKHVIQTGRIVREETRVRGGYPKCTVRGFVWREIGGLRLTDPCELEVACGVGDVVVFITAYWVD